jgi:hypothetical protein
MEHPVIKWLALLIAFIALFSAADQSKTRDAFDRVNARLNALENRKCILMAVSTPTGVASICVEDSQQRNSQGE